MSIFPSQSNKTQKGMDIRLAFLLLILTENYAFELNIEMDANENNVLRPEYGANFRSLGQLNQNLNRVTVVTSIGIPKLDDIIFKDLHWKCVAESLSKNPNITLEKYTLVQVNQMCAVMDPYIAHLRKKEIAHREALTKIFSAEIESLIPDLAPSKRPKRFLPFLIPAVTGLITLAVEGVSTYIKSRQQKKINKAVESLRKEQKVQNTFRESLNDDFLMYGKYSTLTFKEIIETVNGLNKRQSRLEEMFSDHQTNWEWYQSKFDGINKQTLFVLELVMYFTQLNEAHDFNYRLLRQAGKDLEKSISKLIQGYLPIEMFTPDTLQTIVNSVEEMIGESHPGYVLALPDVSHFYDMKLVTFAVDQQTRSLIVSFPVFVREHSITNMQLFEIETIHVPVVDLDETIDSYTKIDMPKSYIATNDNYYITLKTTELLMCKEIRFNYYCEELFIVKHIDNLECANALLFGLSSRIITNHCQFQFYYNISVPPSVLDGGTQLLLANIQVDGDAKCHRSEGLPTALETQNYVLLDRTILCMCRLDLDMNFLLRDLNSCPTNKTGPPTYKINMGMFDKMQIYFPNLTNGLSTEFTETEQKFPFKLPKIEGLQAGENLEAYLYSMEELLQHDHQKGHEMSDFFREEGEIISDKHSTILVIITAVLTVILIVSIAMIAIKQCKLRTMFVTAVPTLVPAAAALLPGAHAVEEMIQEGCKETEVVCKISVFAWVTSAITCFGLILYLGSYLLKLTWLKGDKTKGDCELILRMSVPGRVIKLKINTLLGHDALFTYTGDVETIRLELEQNFLGDMLMIDWGEYKLFRRTTETKMMTFIECPIMTKYVVRRMMANAIMEINVLARQGDHYVEIRNREKM